MDFQPVLSHFQADALLTARKSGKPLAISTIDLGITSCEAILNDSGVTFPNQSIISWATLEEINSNRNSCYIVKDRKILPIKGFSQFTNRSFSLMPTISAPALIIAGFPMHRIKDTDPIRSVRSMTAAISPLRGMVLDTATGLGYAAIECAKTADQVLTIEFDPVAQDMAALNPWSRDLFGNPKIKQMTGDSAEEILKFPDHHFDRILHDPPALCLAGDLYSGVFYRQIYRVLKPGGRAFHYIGDPASASGGRTTKGVIKRLHEAGFKKVVPEAEAFGVVVYK